MLDQKTHEVKAPKGYRKPTNGSSKAAGQRLSCDPEYGGPGPAYRGQPVRLRVPQFGESGVDDVSGPHAWRLRMPCTSTARPEQKALYLPKITTGEWTGTMCLTEPHCGTDLGLLRTKAEPNADGSYTITGNKIFISSGEHDLAENIMHLVLARLPMRRRGSKGISLFIVPKFIANAGDGRSASATRFTAPASNTRWASTAMPPARSALDGAKGWLVGQPNKARRDVRDDERRAHRRWHAVAGPD